MPPSRTRVAARRAFLAAAGSMLVLLVVLVAGAGSQGCQSPTQVTVELRTFGSLPCTSLKGVAIVVAGSPRAAEDRMKIESLSAQVGRGECGADGHLIGTLVVTPSGGAGAIMVRARTSDAPDATCQSPDYKGCIVARRSFTFIDHASVTLPISLEAACVDVPCDVESSCRSGVCVGSTASCVESSGTCDAVAEPQAAPDGGSIPPPPDATVEAGPITTTDGSPDLDSAMDGPLVDAPFDAPKEGGGFDGAFDGPKDGPSDGSNPDGLCPTNGGNVNCPGTGFPACCMQPAGFTCTAPAQCLPPYPKFLCTGPGQCGGGVCCGGAGGGDAGDAGAQFTATCYGAGTSCKALGNMETICGSNADCPAGTPSCTRVSHQYNGHVIWSCQ